MLSNVTFSANSADNGGGLSLFSSFPAFNQVSLIGNSADEGGGMYLDGSNPKMTNITLNGNEAVSGGALFVLNSKPTLVNATITNNLADLDGGGLYLANSHLTAVSSIFAYNDASTGGNFFLFECPSDCISTVSLSYSNVYNPLVFGIDYPMPTGTYTTREPEFLTYARSTTGASCLPGSSLTCLPDDLHLALTSPLVNAGDPETFDVDGSRADMGIYGGPDGDAWDADGDGFPDYFWPGEWSDAPVGFDKAAYDCDDLDAAVQGCE